MTKIDHAVAARNHMAISDAVHTAGCPVDFDIRYTDGKPLSDGPYGRSRFAASIRDELTAAFRLPAKSSSFTSG